MVRPAADRGASLDATRVRDLVPRSVLSRATDAVANRLDRRSFLARSAIVGSALVTAPADLLLHPKSAYAAVCSCIGQSCECGSLCCDGYTEFCCAIYGTNACPTGSLTGGWWKADGSSFCGGAARYYMDCHKPCGSCGCGSSGLCSGTCNGTPCGCGNGLCDHRKAGCTSFRYGNCNNGTACIGPIQCRVVTCTEPWKIEPTCSSSAVRTDNGTATHNRPCLQTSIGIQPIAGDWNGDGTFGIGFYDNRTGTWSLRQTLTDGAVPSFRFGLQPGDRAVVGDWDKTGTDGVAIFRKGVWTLSNRVGPAVGVLTTPPWGQQAGDIPVAGDWNGDGADSVGLFRTGGYWNLSNLNTVPKVAQVFLYGQQVGDLPVVGDWDDDGKDGIGIFRHGEWHLNNVNAVPATTMRINFGLPGDLPVAGDWFGLGRDSIGVYRPSEGKWYLRRSLTEGAITVITWGEKWYVG